MRSLFKSLTRLVATALLAAPLMGCVAEAEETEETAGASTNEVAAGDEPTNEISASPAEANPVESDAASAGGATNQVNGEATAVQEITVINEVPPTIPENLKLTKGVEEIVKLVQAGMSEPVILLFVEKAEEPFDLDADEILYLRDIGVTQTVLAAMLNHDGVDESLAEVIDTNKTEVATAPEPQAAEAALSGPSVEVTTNYVATAPVGQAVSVPHEQQYVEQQPQVVVQQQPQVVYTTPAVTHSYFYSSLAPYGSWIEVDGYGWCWQPTIAVSYNSWRPYTHGGRWLWSDAGWYWHSNYSWGWAPFHYGRWFSAPHRGWVWMPDYTWGPSWVTWRHSHHYAGWAPLPPRAHYRPGFGFSYWGRNVGVNFHFGLGHEHYSFVPTRSFCDPRLVNHVIPTRRTVNIYKDSTVINNYIVGNNNTIINRGISKDLVASRSGQEIRKVGIRDLPGGPRRTVAPNRLQKQGDDLVVFRPSPPPPRLAASVPNGGPSEEAVRRLQQRPNAPVRTGASTGRESGEGTVINPRSAANDSLRAGRETGRPVSPSRDSSAPSRVRTEVASRGTQLPTWAKPAPFERPEPVPVVTKAPERSRTAQEASRVSNGLVATSQTGRPQSLTAPVRNQPSRSIAARPQWNQSSIDVPGARLRSPGTDARPTAPVRNLPSTVPGSSAPSRPDVSRPASPRSTAPIRIPNAGQRLELSRPSAPPRLSSTTPVPGAAPSRVEPSRSAASVRQQSTPAPVRRSTAPVRSAPSVTPSAPVRTTPSNGRFGVAPNSSRPSAPPRVAPAPQSVQRQQIFSRPATVAPSVSAPPRQFSQPRAAVPAPAPAPRVMTPAPVRQSAPRPVTVQPGSSAPARSYSAPPRSYSAPPRSAPSAPPRAAPAPVRSSGGSRGRVEIGR